MSDNEDISESSGDTNSISHADAGSAEEQGRLPSRARLFGILTILWSFPTAGAVTILAISEHRWLKARSVGEGLQAVGFEQWIALGVTGIHLTFALLAWKGRRQQSAEQT